MLTYSFAGIGPEPLYIHLYKCIKNDILDNGIQEAVSIPVMAKCRIGHFVEAQILEAIEIDYIDESEVLSPADDIYHIDKHIKYLQILYLKISIY